MHTYHDLKPITLFDCKQIARPLVTEQFDLETPALQVLTDFVQTQPLMLPMSVGLDEVMLLMRKTHVRSMIVVDGEENFMGLLTLADLESRKVLSVAASRGMKRSDLTAGDIMTPRANLFGVSYSEISHSRIGDLMRTLQHEGTQHMLVVDTGTHQIRGLISAADLAKKLQIPVNVSLKVTTFSEIVSVIRSNRDV